MDAVNQLEHEMNQGAMRLGALKDMTAQLSWDYGAEECRRGGFSVDEYAIGILLRLPPELEHVRISHPEMGELLVSPRRGQYISRISDAAGFFQAHKSSLAVTEINDQFPPVALTLRMEDLLWEAALHASQGRLIDDLRKYDVVQFTRWPNLTRVSLTPNVMRICALLTRYPSGICLGYKILKVDEAEMYSVCSAAKIIGIVNLVNRKIQPDAEDEALLKAHEQGATEAKSGLLGRLFSKLTRL